MSASLCEQWGQPEPNKREEGKNATGGDPPTRKPVRFCMKRRGAAASQAVTGRKEKEQRSAQAILRAHISCVAETRRRVTYW